MYKKPSFIFFSIFFLSVTFSLYVMDVTSDISDESNFKYDASYNNYKAKGVFAKNDPFYTEHDLQEQIIKNMPDNCGKLLRFTKQKLERGTALKKNPLLFVGSPGTGKTCIAKTFGSSLTKNGYYFVCATSLRDQYKNSGIQNIINEIEPFFNYQGSDQGYTIIFDEIDALTQNFNNEHCPDQGISQQLWLTMDKLVKETPHFFIGISNKNASDFPEALLDRIGKSNVIKISLPDYQQRLHAIEYNASLFLHQLNQADLALIAHKTKRKSLREIETIFNEAEKIAWERNKEKSFTINKADIKKAIQICNPSYFSTLYNTCKKNKTMFLQVIPSYLPIALSLIPTIISLMSLKSQYQSIALQYQSFGTQNSALNLQRQGLEMQEQALNLQKQAFDCQERALNSQDKSLDVQKSSSNWQTAGTAVSIAATLIPIAISVGSRFACNII